MRDPNELIQIYISDKEDSGIINLSNLQPVEIEEYDLLDPTDLKRYFDDIEKMVRTSFEYSRFVSYLRDNMAMNQCAFFENVSNTDTYNIKIHIHHDPFTLYDIVRTVFSKRVFYNEPLDIELVSLEVMYLHYNLLVGLVPLSETVHELVHNNYLFVPTNIVLGKYREFRNQYQQFIPVECIDTLDRIEEATSLYELNKDLLQRKYIYYNFSDDQYKLPSMEDIRNMMNVVLTERKQQELKSNTLNSRTNK